MHTLVIVIACILCSVLAQTTANDNVTEPISTYISRPDLQVPALNVSIQNSDPENGFQSGYMFICPYQATQHGPYIYDKFGNLVWSGYNASDGTNNSMALRTCTYQGADHLCVYKGAQQEGYGRGHGIIMNKNYEIVQTVQTGNGEPAVDIHEFNVINGGETALVSAYGSLQYDLSAYKIAANPQYLMQGIFQEVNISSGDVIFDWRSIDHVPITASYVLPATTDVSGNGTAAAPWDYFHINAIDKSSASGRYLVSSRHTSSIFLIDPSDGSIIWTLSCGGLSDFAVSGFNFTFQHDARFMSENDTHTVISIFDNASNGFNRSNTQSSGMVISIDLNAKTASLVSQTFAPTPGGILSDSQGNTQIFSNGAVFHGWGSTPAISETNAAGEPVLFAQYGAYPVMNYRAYSDNWAGYPLDKPAIVAPAQVQNVTTPFIAYVSWNGATEVKTWRFWGSLSDDGGFTPMGNVTKAGFETMYTSKVYNPFVFVEALADDGTSLGNSSVLEVNQLDGQGNEIEPSSAPLSTSMAPNSTSMSSTATSMSSSMSASMTAAASLTSSAASAASPTTTGAATEMADSTSASLFALVMAAVALMVATIS